MGEDHATAAVTLKAASIERITTEIMTSARESNNVIWAVAGMVRRVVGR
jgi:hypothetical protein